ncbi:phosphoglycerate kinase [Methanocella sp. CWC-04]|uniref:Phosphoglycerate kinase n=1 Tax=Methanooceanicella nereidis TaxID=2052831 RepID=A0AAP2W5J4_9EURY|nr:phosphoglycerate kinase [Methanocella sp. CWC-04]MCD1294373.1 phosphoglycerate kinase [Methanocella sp. CWC-04]
MTIKTVKDIDVTSKRVLVRVDFNVPMNSDGIIGDDTRIRACLPTIKYLIDKHAKIIICSHLDRPHGKVEESLRLAPVAKRLSELISRPVRAMKDCIGPDVENAVSKMHDGDVVLLENLRFHPGEKENDPGFARALSRLGEVYVNDAFSVSHRSHASIVGIPKHLPAVAGLLMENELVKLGKLLERPEKPFAAMMGGAKVSDKLGFMENIINRVDLLIIGGGMAATFLKSEGYRVGKSLVENDRLQYVRDLKEKAKSLDVRLFLPVDVVITEDIHGSSGTRTVPVSDIPDGWAIADIGPRTISDFSQALKECKTVFWNGPMGVFEIQEFSHGTHAMATVMSKLDAVTVIGGGSTVEAVTKMGLEDKMSHVSTGGGATLKFLSGETLPGVAALSEKMIVV